VSRFARGLPLSDTRRRAKGTHGWVASVFHLNLSTLFTGDILSLFVASQPKKDRLTELVVAGPLGELNLGDQHTCRGAFSSNGTAGDEPAACTREFRLEAPCPSIGAGPCTSEDSIISSSRFSYKRARPGLSNMTKRTPTRMKNAPTKW